jgi:hypothetical protein
VDDVYAMGGTMLGLMGKMQDAGAKHLPLVFEMGTRYGKMIKPSREQIDNFKKMYNITDEQVKEITGHELSQFTAAELQALSINPNRKRGAEGLRRVYAQGDGQEESRRQQGLGQESSSPLQSGAAEGTPQEARDLNHPLPIPRYSRQGRSLSRTPSRNAHNKGMYYQ